MTMQRTDTQKDLYNTLMMEYATGVLDELHSLMVASHLTLSPQARRHIALCEQLGGMMMEQQCRPVAMKTASLQNVLDQLDDKIADDHHTKRETVEQHKTLKDMPIPQPICRYVSVHVTRRKPRWRRVYPGIRTMKVSYKNGEPYNAQLAQIKPGARIPPHRHNKTEMTLVLQGALIDEHGTHKRGDLVIMDAGTAHHPKACPEQGCLCFVVYDAPLDYIGKMGALLNFFSR